VTVNLANLPANAGREALVVPVEAVFNPDNHPRNEPHVWVIKGDGEQLHLEDRKVSVGQVTTQGWLLPTAQRRRARCGGWRQRTACPTAGSNLDA
jgi:hypothetical protein